MSLDAACHARYNQVVRGVLLVGLWVEFFFVIFKNTHLVAKVELFGGTIDKDGVK